MRGVPQIYSIRNHIAFTIRDYNIFKVDEVLTVSGLKINFFH